MRLTVLAATGLLAATAAATKPAKKCTKHCFNAIVSDTPASIGKAFCSAFLSLEPEVVTATVTVVHQEVFTTTHTNTELTTITETTTATSKDTTTTSTTETTTGTTTASTLTTTTGTVTMFAKRAAQSSSNASASILSVCKTRSAQISKICSFLLPAASAATSTLTSDQTATSTSVSEYTTTSTGTSTSTFTSTITDVITSTITDTTISTVTATQNAEATQRVQPVRNGDFETGLAPWTRSTSTGYVDHFYGAGVCLNGNTVCHPSAVVRLIPLAGTYVGISQVVQALPLTSYRVKLLLHTAPVSSTPTLAVQVAYNGIVTGTFERNTRGPDNGFWYVDIWEFTTDASGTGTLEIRTLNRGAQSSLYFYLDEISITQKM